MKYFFWITKQVSCHRIQSSFVVFVQPFHVKTMQLHKFVRNCFFCCFLSVRKPMIILYPWSQTTKDYNVSLKTQPRPLKGKKKVSTVLHMNATLYIWDDIAVGCHMIVSDSASNCKSFPFKTVKLYKQYSWSSNQVIEQLVTSTVSTNETACYTKPCTSSWESNMIKTDGLYFGTSNQDFNWE